MLATMLLTGGIEPGKLKLNRMKDLINGRLLPLPLIRPDLRPEL